MSSHSQEEFYQGSNTPSLIEEQITIPNIEETPEFCKRIRLEDVEINARMNTHKELLRMGELININKQTAKQEITNDIFKIKTMSLQELDEYVENKLSKEHYSPEVIYLLFKIQTLLLEKEHMNMTLYNNDKNIKNLQKELIDNKAEIEKLKADHIIDQQKMTDLIEIINTAQAELLYAEEELAKLRGRNKINTQSEIKRLKSELLISNAKYEELKKSCLENDILLKALQAKFDSTLTNLNVAKQKLTTSLSKLNTLKQ